MRLVTFSDGKPVRVGAVVGNEVVDLAGAVPNTMLEALAGGDAVLDAARRACDAAPRLPLDELGDPHELRLRTRVNGEVRQDAVTGEMLVDCFRQVEVLSTAFTLEPGDVIATGTPAGIGATQDPPRFLRAGDTVRVEIDGLGALENPVVDEPQLEVA
jgi:hypothetical protein